MELLKSPILETHGKHSGYYIPIFLSGPDISAIKINWIVEKQYTVSIFLIIFNNNLQMLNRVSPYLLHKAQNGEST